MTEPTPLTEAEAAMVGWGDRPSITRHSHMDQILAIERLVAALRSLIAYTKTLETERDDLVESLDKRWEHSDHLTAKYYGRMRAAEREMHSRELHHFEEEQKSEEAVACAERAEATLANVREALRPIHPGHDGDDPERVEFDYYRRAQQADSAWAIFDASAVSEAPAPTEPDWEYGVMSPAGRMLNNGNYRIEQTHRRRKAGPWEPVESVESHV